MNRSPEKYAKQLERSRDWKQKNKERHAELARAYRERNREKTKAQNLLNYAVRTGKIVRLPCEVCGTQERVHAHHHDYSKPYEVRWLCYVCHKLTHPVDDEDKAIKFSKAKKARLPGSLNPNAALNDEQVRQVKILLDFGFSQERIAAVFGVHQTTIGRIKLGRHYVE